MIGWKAKNEKQIHRGDAETRRLNFTRRIKSKIMIKIKNDKSFAKHDAAATYKRRGGFCDEKMPIKTEDFAKCRLKKPGITPFYALLRFREAPGGAAERHKSNGQSSRSKASETWKKPEGSPSSLPNGFPSPPPVSFPTRGERFALRGPAREGDDVRCVTDRRIELQSPLRMPWSIRGSTNRRTPHPQSLSPLR